MRNFINIFENIQAEADEDDVIEAIHAFSDKLESQMHRDGIQVPYNEIYPTDNQNFPQLFMGGYPEDGFSKEVALQIIQPLVSQLSDMGWFLSKHFETSYDDGDDDGASPQIMIYFGFFPRKGEAVRVPRLVYHAAPTSQRTRIAHEGLKASNGGSDFIHTETGRVYVVLDDENIDEIKNDIVKHRGPTELDVWVIDTEYCTNEWYDDIELSGFCAWTPHDIPANAIGLW